MLKVAIAGLLMALAGAVGAQQEYPTKPIRIVVPYPPGASNDFLARLFAPKLTELLGVQVLVDNRGGGNTVIGNEHVAKSAPDGYTLLLAGSSQISIPHLYRTLPYDSINDFAPVAGIARSEFMLVVHPSLPVTTVKDLVALAKKRPGAIDYATSSTGGGTHLAAVQFEMVAGVKLQQVAYKGGGPAIVDLLGGHVQVAFSNPATAVPLVRTGRLRGLATTGEKRLESLPQVPTFTESGFPGLALRNWYAISAPAATPRTIIDKLSTAIQKVTAMPDVKAAIVKQGMESFYGTPEQIDVMRREDNATVAKLIKAANIKLLN
jgi:tripartite-type tricarboxylate transporter receptor subunit TctC